MSDPFLDKFMAELIKGAEQAEGFVRGGRVGVEVKRDHGHEEKLANHAGLGALGGGLLLPGIGAPVGAALGADEGQGGSAALGSILGGAGGGLGGAGIGALLAALAGSKPGLGAAVGGAVGGLGGSVYGAHRGGHKDTLTERIGDKLSALEQRYTEGAEAAVTHFGIKEAFLPLLGMAGSLLGGTALRGGLGMAAKGLAGKAGIGGAIGRGAQGALNWAGKGGMRGGALDMAGSMAGGAAGNMLQGGQ